MTLPWQLLPTWIRLQELFVFGPLQDEKNVKCIAPFTIEYLKGDLDLEHEKLYSAILLEKKNDQIYISLQTKDCEKELSAAQTMGLQLAYDNFCVLNQNNLSADWLLTYMAQSQMKDSLQQMPTLHSVEMQNTC